jgi:hypothetical protein
MTNPVRNRVFVLKLKNYADPANRQRGVKGSCISFPQANPMSDKMDVLPRPLSDLPEMLQVVFVGSKPPTEAQLAKIFYVDADDVRQSLRQWNANGHPGFTGTWSEENLANIAACPTTASIIADCVNVASEEDDKPSVTSSTSIQETANAARPETVDVNASLPLLNSTPVVSSSSDDFANPVPQGRTAEQMGGSDNVELLARIVPGGAHQTTLTGAHCNATPPAAESSSSTLPDGTTIEDADDSDVDDVGGTEYVEEVDDPTEAYTEMDDVYLESSGMLNVDGLAEDMTDAVAHAVRSMLHTKVPHDSTPVNQFDDPAFWANALPVLFPFGSGGYNPKSHPVKLSLTSWIRHMLLYHDGRFQTDPSFLYVCYNVLQTQVRLTMSHILYKKVFSNKATNVTNSLTTEMLAESLKVLAQSKTLRNQGPAAAHTTQFVDNAKVVGKEVNGSVFQRGACRPELCGLVTNKGLPNLFVTVNPSDIQNPIVSFWNSSDPGTDDAPIMQFNLDTLAGAFPTENLRAKLVGDNPVLPALFFNTLIEAFLESFLGFEIDRDSPNTCLQKGKLLNETIFTGENSRGLKAFYGTVECQGRGSLHLHLLIWLSGVPPPAGTPSHLFPTTSTHNTLMLH